VEDLKARYGLKAPGHVRPHLPGKAEALQQQARLADARLADDYSCPALPSRSPSASARSEDNSSLRPTNLPGWALRAPMGSLNHRRHARAPLKMGNSTHAREDRAA
jgi:hypothetical protein